MSTRHQARATAFQILFQYDIAQNAGADVRSDLDRHFRHFQTPKKIQDFVSSLVIGTLENLPKLDPMIQERAANWKLARMAVVDRNLLRMALFEILHLPETAPAIIMDEVIELAKQFGNQDSPAFINGVLDSIVKTAK